MAGAAGSRGLLWLLGALLQLLKLCTFSVSLGLELLVFWTMTFYMLSSPTDSLTRLVRTVLPRASVEVLGKLQVTPPCDTATWHPATPPTRQTTLRLGLGLGLA